MKTLLMIACSAAFICPIAAATEETAEAAYWQTQGNGCVWSSKYDTPGTQAETPWLAFNAGSGTDIVAWCPITSTALNGQLAHVGFYVYNGSANSSVALRLYKMSKSTFDGTQTLVCSVGALTTGYQKIYPNWCNFTANTDTYVYWFEVELTRTVNNVYPAFYAMELY